MIETPRHFEIDPESEPENNKSLIGELENKSIDDLKAILQKLEEEYIEHDSSTDESGLAEDTNAGLERLFNKIRQLKLLIRSKESN